MGRSEINAQIDSAKPLVCLINLLRTTSLATEKASKETSNPGLAWPLKPSGPYLDSLYVHAVYVDPTAIRALDPRRSGRLLS